MRASPDSSTAAVAIHRITSSRTSRGTTAALSHSVRHSAACAEANTIQPRKALMWKKASQGSSMARC